jgi:hypothetical protein
MLFACKKSTKETGHTQFTQDSIALSGIYTGTYVVNRQITYTHTNSYDTLPVHVIINLIDSLHLDVASSNSDYHDTLLKTIDSTTGYGESAYYYQYNTQANGGTGFVVNVYYYSAKDSIYINAFPPPCCGYSTYYLFNGKK